MRWSDIDLCRKRLAVRQTIVSVNYRLIFKDPKTDNGRRLIALDTTTVAALQAHRQRQDEERRLLEVGYQDRDLVFAKEDGRPVHPDYFSQLFDRTVAKLSVPRIRLHDLRHTHATLGLQAGVPPKLMSDRLGHSNVAFTLQKYTHAIPRLEHESAEQMAELIFTTKAKP